MDDEIMGFQLNIAAMEEFFQRCIDRKADTLKERLKIMSELQKELRVVKLNETDIKRIVKNKKMLRIKANDLLNPEDKNNV